MANFKINDLSGASFPISGGELLEIDTKQVSTKMRIDHMLSTKDVNETHHIAEQSAFMGLENVLQLSAGPYRQIVDSFQADTQSAVNGPNNPIVFDNGYCMLTWDDGGETLSYVVTSGAGGNLGVVNSGNIDGRIKEGGGYGALLPNGYEAAFVLLRSAGLPAAELAFKKVNFTGAITASASGVITAANPGGQMEEVATKVLPNGNIMAIFRDYGSPTLSANGPLSFIIVTDEGSLVVDRTIIAGTELATSKGDFTTTVLPNGNVVIVWRRTQALPYRFRGAIYDQHGNLVTAATSLFETNAFGGDQQIKLGAFKNGNFLFAYRDRANGNLQDIFFRIYDQNFNEVKGQTLALDFNTSSFSLCKTTTMNNQVVLFARKQTGTNPTLMAFIDHIGNIRQSEADIWGTASNQGGVLVEMQGNTKDGRLYITKTNSAGSNGVYLDIWSGSSPFTSGIFEVVNGSTTFTVTFDNPQPDANYQLFTELVNTVDSPPTVFYYLITNKTTTGFSVRFNGSVDSGNFEFHWSTLRVPLVEVEVGV